MGLVSALGIIRAASDHHSNEETAQLVNIAARCAKAVYPGEGQPDIPRHSIRQTFKLEPSSFDSLTKVSALYVAERVSVDEGRLTTIVVSIRGSKSIVDWMVNANNHAADVKDFIVYLFRSHPSVHPLTPCTKEHGNPQHAHRAE